MADALIPLAVKLLWDESRPLRKLIYSRLPFAKDAAKQKLAEDELGKLLEDSHKLAKSLSPAQADQAIDKRVAVFRQDLIRGHIPEDQVNTIVERGEMFVRMLVTEPILEVSILKARVAEIEKAFLEMEAKFEAQSKELEKLKGSSKNAQIMALWVGFAILLILEIVQMLRAGGVH